MKRFRYLLTAFATGLLLWGAWPVSPLTFLIFIAFIPLLWLESVVNSSKHFFGLTYLTMLTWNIATTWWIWNASIPGAVAAFFANSLIMCLPWLGFRIAKKRLGEKFGYAALIAFWMCFEYIHLLDWGLSWPWLTLGNAFATHPEWVLWYQYSGTSGGTLWILLVNIFLFLHLQKNMLRKEKKNYRFLFSGIVILILPVVLSLTGRQYKTPPYQFPNVIVVQPNIDPYVKVSDANGSFEAQLAILISESEKLIDDQTALVVWPETALYMGGGIDEEELKPNLNQVFQPLWDFMRRNPQIELFTGVESFRQVPAKTKYSEEFNGAFYESYNGSMLADSSGARSFYHKSMLVPGVETLPWFLKFIDNWFKKFGGTTAGYAKQTDRTVLPTKKGYVIAPAICYESIYGEFMAKYVKNGANLICIVTNDGWWKNTPGHKQHMNYARLRAIETQKWVARSANTGISCFIDPGGNIIQPQPYDTKAAIKLSIPMVPSSTFFVRNGDILSKLMAGLSGVFLLLTIVNKFRRKRRD